MELHLKIAGFLLMLLALVHGFFPKYFNWKIEFSSVSLINRQVMYVHAFFIALTVFLMGLLCATSATDLIETRLGNRLMLALAVFWAARLAIQFFGYSTELWKGKRFETAAHIVFSLLWSYLSLVFFIVFWMSKSR